MMLVWFLVGLVMLLLILFVYDGGVDLLDLCFWYCCESFGKG